MFFRNATIYQLTQPAQLYIDALEKKINESPFTPCGSLQVLSSGFVPPFSENLTYVAYGACLMCLKRQERRIAPAAVADLLEEQVEQVERQQDRKVYRKERLTMKDEIILGLLPNTPTVSSRTYAYIDPVLNMIVVDTGSTGRAEDLLVRLRQTLGGFPAVIPQIEAAPAGIMTEWLYEAPGDFDTGMSCELRPQDGSTAVTRFKGQLLDCPAVSELLLQGFQAVSMELTWRDHVSFTLLEPGRLKGIQFNDELLAGIEQDVESEADVFDADLQIMIPTMRQLINDIGEAFGGFVEQGHLDVASEIKDKAAI